MGLAAGQDGAIDGYEPVEARPGQASAPQSGTAMFRRRCAQPSRRGVLYLQTAGDTPVPPELASWFTERGFHFYLAALSWRSAARRRDGKALAATFAELDAKCEHLRSTDGIDNVIVIAHGAGALAAALWCAEQHPGSRADALILYAPVFSRAVRRGLDIPCPVLVIGGPSVTAGPDSSGSSGSSGSAGGDGSRRRRPRLRRHREPTAIELGGHVTWLRPADGEARPDGREAADRSRFFDEMGRWLGAYMYGQVRDQLL
jgi:alpha-beta hydrolase superfamily lysophospholipase